jgi:hypothetical protein
VVNDGAIMNNCNPWMMHCFVYHFIQLKLLDVEKKHKGLVSYNNNHDSSILKKHVCHKHPDLYKKLGFSFVTKGYRNPE